MNRITVPGIQRYDQRSSHGYALDATRLAIFEAHVQDFTCVDGRGRFSDFGDWAALALVFPLAFTLREIYLAHRLATQDRTPYFAAVRTYLSGRSGRAIAAQSLALDYAVLYCGHWEPLTTTRGDKGGFRTIFHPVLPDTQEWVEVQSDAPLACRAYSQAEIDSLVSGL